MKFSVVVVLGVVFGWFVFSVLWWLWWGDIFWCEYIEYVGLCLVYAKVYMCVCGVYYYTICLKKDILYMCKTEIQLKKI